MSQDVRFVEPVAQFPEYRDAPVEARQGSVVVAKLSVDIAEAVPGTGLALPLAEFLVQRYRLLATGQSLLVLPEPGMTPAHVVEHGGLPALVAGRQEQLIGLPGMIKRVARPSLPVRQRAEAAVHPPLADAVAHLPVDVQGLAEVGTGLVPVVEPSAGLPEPVVGRRLLA